MAPRRWIAFALLLACCPALPAQEPPPTSPAGSTTPGPPPAAPTDSPEPAPQHLLPSLDVYIPDGELDFRLNGLIKNAFYEGQVRYNFPRGDISAFLRYRYYGLTRTYLLSVFDQIDFSRIERFNNEFSRVRGALFLVELPQSFSRRMFLLGELDSISSNKEEFRFSTNRTNTFLKAGYQIGTPNDTRSNAIVGESRAKIDRLFTAHQEIGPHGAGLTGALTYGFDVLGGDFSYLKAEVETLKRFDLPGHDFLVARLHGGSFLTKKLARTTPDIELFGRYAIPRSEFFRLGGRDQLKGVDRDRIGTEEVHTTVEVFMPWFEHSHRRALHLDWHTWYWILYAGYGAVGFDRAIYTTPSDYIPDVGVGFETSFRLRNYTFFASGILAQPLRGSDGLAALLVFKSYH